MTASSARPLGTCACLVALAVALAGCGGGTSTTSAAKNGTKGGAVASVQKLAGGGGFCRAIEQSVKPPTPTSGDTTKALLDTARAEGKRALSLAPSALKADVAVLNDASDSVYEALEKVDFDYTRLTSTDLGALSGKDVTAAEEHLTTYISKTCGLDVTSAAGASPPTSADAPSADPAAATGVTACNLATDDQVSAAIGKPVKPSGGTDTVCSFSVTSEPGLFVYVQIYADKHSMAAMNQIEGISDHVPDLGDDAFWAGPTGIVFVRKGDRAFSLSVPSLANLSDDPDAMKAKMLTLAAQALVNF